MGASGCLGTPDRGHWLIRYYITDRHGLGSSIPALLDNIERVASTGVELIQLRERDLSGRDLLELTRAARRRIAGSNTKLLVNDRLDVALAAEAHGVHLRSHPVSPQLLRAIVPDGFQIAVSCHTAQDTIDAAGADFVVCGPVFVSPGKGTPIGLEGLAAVVSVLDVPVLALGGITLDTAPACLSAGAAGIAAIRLFQS